MGWTMGTGGLVRKSSDPFREVQGLSLLACHGVECQVRVEYVDPLPFFRSHLLTGNWASRAMFSLRTFTRDCPTNPSAGRSVYWSTSCWMAASEAPRAFATRLTSSFAVAGLTCGSSPLADAVTASEGSK